MEPITEATWAGWGRPREMDPRRDYLREARLIAEHGAIEAAQLGVYMCAEHYVAMLQNNEFLDRVNRQLNDMLGQ